MAAHLVDDLVRCEVLEQDVHLFDALPRARVANQRRVGTQLLEQCRAALVLDILADFVGDGGVKALLLGHLLLDLCPCHLYVMNIRAF